MQNCKANINQRNAGEEANNGTDDILGLNPILLFEHTAAAQAMPLMDVYLA